MKTRNKVIICMGILTASVLHGNILTGYAASRNADLQSESMNLIQEGGFQIPETAYNFEEDENERIHSFRAAEETEDKQKIAAAQRANGNITLEERKKACASELYSGMVALEKQIDVARFALTKTEFKQVISDVVNSNPELFYIRNGYKVGTFPLSDTDNTEIVDFCCGFYEYQDTERIPNPQKEKINTLVKEVETKQNQILSDIISTGMNNMEKALMIHEYLVLHTQYDYAADLLYKADGQLSHFEDSDYDIYGTLIKGQAVCQGYALSYKYLLEAAGVRDVGFASNDNHIWNTVTLNGANYFVDCTWDDTNWDTLGNVKHKNFLKNESSFQNHTIVTTDRACTGTTYNDMFWDDVDSGIFYYRGFYYYVGNSGYLCKIKLRTDAGIEEGASKVVDLKLNTTASWTYKNAAKITLAGLGVIYHDGKQIYVYDLKNDKTESLYQPQLAENELIYGVRYENGTFEYATRNQTVTASGVEYSNEEQKIYTETLPDTLFRVPVDSVTISGPDTIWLSMKDGKYVNDTISLKAEILPVNATDKRIWKWVSSDTKIATTDINGKVKGLKPGTVTVTAIANDGKVEGTYTVKILYDGVITQEDGSVIYYEDGKKITNQFYQVDGKTYYLGADGEKVTGWRIIDEKTYYFKEPGIYVTGMQTIGSKYYYFDKNGVMQTGWQTINGKRHYFNENGVMATGWKDISTKRYYFGSKGILVTGWNTIEGKRYYFDKNGAMVKGWKTVSKKKYYLDSNGVMVTGWKTIAKKRYYFSKAGVMTTGWKTINKKKYYFSKKGVMTTGWKTIKKKKYYFDKKGVMVTGWKTIRKKQYYFNKKGVMQKGLVKIKGIPYYFASDGHLVG